MKYYASHASGCPAWCVGATQPFRKRAATRAAPTLAQTIYVSIGEGLGSRVRVRLVSAFFTCDCPDLPPFSILPIPQKMVDKIGQS